MQGARLVVGKEDEITPGGSMIAERSPFRVEVLDRPPDGDGIAGHRIGRIKEEVITLPGGIAEGLEDEGTKLIVLYLSSVDSDLDQVVVCLGATPQMEEHIVGIFASVGSHERIYAVKAVIGGGEELPDGDRTTNFTRRGVSHELTNGIDGKPL